MRYVVSNRNVWCCSYCTKCNKSTDAFLDDEELLSCLGRAFTHNLHLLFHWYHTMVINYQRIIVVVLELRQLELRQMEFNYGGKSSPFRNDSFQCCCWWTTSGAPTLMCIWMNEANFSDFSRKRKYFCNKIPQFPVGSAIGSSVGWGVHT